MRDTHHQAHHSTHLTEQPMRATVWRAISESLSPPDQRGANAVSLFPAALSRVERARARLGRGALHAAARRRAHYIGISDGACEEMKQ